MKKNEKLNKIDIFLSKLGEVKKNNESVDGFYIICKKCGSQNIIKYDDTGCGSEYTGCWGDAGLKCKECGNSAELMNF